MRAKQMHIFVRLELKTNKVDGVIFCRASRSATIVACSVLSKNRRCFITPTFFLHKYIYKIIYIYYEIIKIPRVPMATFLHKSWKKINWWDERGLGVRGQRGEIRRTKLQVE